MGVRLALVTRTVLPLGLVLGTCTACQPAVDVFVRNDRGTAVQVNADEGAAVGGGPGYARVAVGARRHIVAISAMAIGVRCPPAG